MEMEYLNDHTMRIFIASSDLKERGISFADMFQNRDAVEQFFLSILEEMDTSRKFKDSSAITFQVMPKNDGIDLYIRKIASSDEIELEGDEAFKQLLSSFDELASSNLDHLLETPASLDQTFSEGLIFRFEHLEYLLAAFVDGLSTVQADLLKIHSSLFTYGDQFFLFISDQGYLLSEEAIIRAFNHLLEYGHYEANLAPFLEEHGQKLLNTNALSTLKESFNLTE